MPFLALLFLPLSLSSLLFLYHLPPRPGPRRDSALKIESEDLEFDLGVLLGELGITGGVEVRLSYEFNAGAYAWKGKKVVRIGYPLLVAFDEYELCGILCHEIAHHLHNDVSSIRAEWRLEEIFTRILGALRGRIGGAMWGPYRYLARKLLVAMKEDSRKRELEADRAAAEIVGVEAYDRAMAKLSSFQESWRRYCRLWLDPLMHFGVRCDLFELYRRYLTLNARDTDPRPLSGARSGGYDTHPSPIERHEGIKETRADGRVAAKLRKIELAGSNYSEFYWSMAQKDPMGELHSSVDRCFTALNAAIRSRYGSILDGVTFGDVRRIRSTYTSLSYGLFELAGVSDADLAKRMTFDVIAACVYSDRLDFPWTIGTDFSPAIQVNGYAISMLDALDSLYEYKEGPWNSIVGILGVGEDEAISKVDWSSAALGPVSGGAV